MIKDILLQVSRSYNPYVQQRELWGMGQTLGGELDSGFNSRKYNPVDNGTNWEIIETTNQNSAVAIKTDGTLWGWGQSPYSGDNTSINRSSPVQIGTHTWVSASAGSLITSAIRSDGTLWAWGGNAGVFAYVGDGTNVAKSSPVQIGTHTWKSVTSLQYGAIAIRSDDTIWAWGQNLGQFGNGETAGGFGIPDNTSGSWSTSAPNRSFTIAIKSNGTMWGWGLNGSGQLGLNDTVIRSSAVQIGTLSTWVSASTAYSHTMAIKNDGTLWGWGLNSGGQLGLGDLVTRSSPVQVGTLNDWKNVSTAFGSSHTIALKTDGTLWGWGTGIYGELGQNPFDLYKIDDGTTWVSASINSQTIALKSDGTMWGWGLNTNGELGLGDVITRSSPVQIGTLSWKKIHGSYLASFGIRTDDTLWSWGSNSTGTLGLGLSTSGQNRSSPVQVGTRTWNMISGNRLNILAIRSDGTLWGWGQNGAGDLGLNNTTSYSSPVQVGTLNDWAQVVSAVVHSHGIRTDGTLWSWGRNTEGQLGLFDKINRSSPVQVGTLTWNKVSVSYDASYAIRTDGTLWAWGINSYNGRLGIGDINDRSSPVQVGTRNDWTDIFTADGLNASTEANYGLRSDGTLWAFGTPGIYNNRNYNNMGSPYFQSPVQIGTRTDWKLAYPKNVTLNAGAGAAYGGIFINTSNEMYVGPAGDRTITTIPGRISYSSPVQIGTETNWASIDAKGGLASSALKTDGTLWTWGYGIYGLHENVSNTYSLGIPTQNGTSTWNNFTLGGYTSYLRGGVKTDGTLWAWGYGFYGVHGLGDVITRSSPVQIGTLNTWSKLSIGQDYAMATKIDGTLWGWGRNNLSQLGLRDTVSRSSPVQVGNETDWYNIFAGDTHTVGIRSRWNYDLYTSGVGTTFGATHNVINGWGRDRLSPIQISQTNPWTSINSGGIDCVMAIKTDGTLWGWGLDAFGQIGTGTVATVRSSPVQVGTRLWKFVKPAQTFTFGIRDDDTLWSWGQNTSGRLGLNDIISRSSPVQVGTRLWTDVEPGVNSTVRAIRTDGTLWSWGALGSLGSNEPSGLNRSSPVQVGTETNWLSAHGNLSDAVATFVRKTNKSLYVTTDGFDRIVAGISFLKSSPVQVTSTGTWRNIFVGRSATIAISNSGSLWFWGVRENGISGDSLSTPQFQESPVQIGTRTDWVSGSFSTNHAMAIRSDNTLWAWGIGTSGQLGLTDLITRSSPVQVGTRLWKQVSTGFNHTIAIRDDDTMWSWGLNTSGRLGLNDAVTRSSPVQIGTRSWTFISAGNSNSFAISSDGTIWGWGLNTTGEVGDNTVTTKSSPVQIGTETNWSKVSSGTSYTMAVKTNGTIWAWGANGNGQLGLLRNRSLPNYVTTTQKFNGISAGYQSVIARSTDGTLWSWGDGVGGAAYGQLGLGDTIARSSPVQIGTLSWSMFSNGGFHASAIRNGELWIWGDNSTGELGLNLGSTALRSSPVQLGTLSNWSSIDNGYLYSLAVKTDGTLWGWGRNNQGELGLSDTISRSSPVQIGTLNNWSSVAAGYVSSHAIKTDGTLWGWGINTNGMLGDNTTTNRTSPVQIGTRTWTRIADKGGFVQTHNMAIRSDGTLWVWGSNASGQLGLNLGSTAHRSSPVQLGTETNWASATAGDDTAMAVRTDGTLWAWGLNSSGELGLGDAVNRSSPVQVGTLTSWASASMGDANSALLLTDGTVLTTGIYAIGYDTRFTINRSNPTQITPDTNWSDVRASVNATVANGFTFAEKTNGTLWSWGGNAFGQLGDGTLITRSSPVQVGVDTTWVDISVGHFHAVGIKQY